MKLERRYIVAKFADARASLTDEELQILQIIMLKTEKYRKSRGKEPLQGLFVENDWPEFQETLDAITKRVEETDEQFCVDCTRLLTDEEIKYYSNMCETCVRKSQEGLENA